MRFRMAVITDDQHKQREIVESLKPYQIDLFSLDEIEQPLLKEITTVLIICSSLSNARIIIEAINGRYPNKLILISCPIKLTDLAENCFQFEKELKHYKKPVETISQRIVALLSRCSRSGLPLKKQRQIVAVSSAMRNVLQLTKRVATQEESVLICGETGTGKDLIAGHLHSISNRKSGPFHVVNCAAVSPQLFDSEFFGHMKGAFTGANRSRKGHFEFADGGTIVLDEIGELEIGLQAKLLRAIDNNEIMPVGSHERKKINVRIIALTNRDLRYEISRGCFREDLFHRLNALQINLPPLRNRPSDVVAIAKHILADTWVAAVPGWKAMFTEEVCNWLCGRQFSGNVRQLRNLLLGVLVSLRPYDITISIRALEKTALLQGVHPKEERKAMDLTANLREVEMRLILRALEENERNITTAARHLGITRQNLQQRMRKLNM